MRTPIHIDNAPRMRPRNVENENTLELRRFDDFETGCVEKRRACGGFATHQWRIQIRSRLPVLIQRSSPWLKWNVGRPRHTAEARPNFPVAFFVGGRSKINVAIRPAGRRFLRKR